VRRTALVFSMGGKVKPMKVETQICRKCGKPKKLQSFLCQSKNGVIHRTVCNLCRVGKNQKQNIAKYIDKCRLDGRRRANMIKSDSKRADIKRGRQNDLDLQFIRNTIANPCDYCDRHDLRIMSLDRIDNSVGHLKTNVVSACIRCNFIRNSMPYAAWIVVAKWVRKANALGLFGNWEGPHS
jgi:hypothetical protein